MSEVNTAPVSTPAPEAPAPADGTEIHQDKAAASGNNHPEAKPGETKAQTEKRMYEYKANGRTRRVSEDDVPARLALAEGAHERLEEAAKLRKLSESALGKLKSNPIEAALEAGLKPDELRKVVEQWYKKSFIDPEAMSPEQRELQELKEWKAQQDKAAQEAKAREDQTAAEQEELAHRESLQKEIIENLDKSGLPKTKFTAGRMAYWMKHNLERGFNAPMEVVVSQVKNERDSIVRSLVDATDGQSLIEMLGEEVVNKIRRFDLDRLRAKTGATAQVQSTEPKPAQTREPRSMRDVDQYFRNLRVKG